ncbi:MAG: SpoIIE family protein phosphatase [Eubacterium sp.]|nr:SpoIIE family protein phosphatase [Eubacterium sp.]
MNRGKRKPIKSKMRLMILLVSLIALFVMGVAAMVSMMYLRARSKEALVSQMENNLRNTVSGRSDLVDSWLVRYSENVDTFADFIHDLYTHPDMVKDMTPPPTSADNKGILTMQSALISEDIKEEDIKEERALLGNLRMIFYPIMIENEGIITSAYIATERGLTMAYDTQSDIKVPYPYFNAWETSWYQLAKEAGKTVFTDVYLDSFGRGLTITCVAPFYEADGSFAGVVGMDILIQDLYQNAISMNMDSNYYAMLVDKKGTVISPNVDANALEKQEGIDSKIISGIMSGATDVAISETDVYFAYSTVKSTDWKFCIRIPEAVVLEPVTDMDASIQITFLLFIAIYLLATLAILVVSKRLSESVTSPIVALGEDAKQISEGNLDHRAVPTTNDEIGDLAESFNTMASELKDYIENLTRVTAEKERIGAELNVATQIQADMLPRIYPAFPDYNEFDIYATMDPAKEVGGDFYDYFLIDDSHLGLVMADVSGKGVPAALFMVIAKTLIKNRAQMGGTPSEILAYVNDQLCDGNEAQLFVTVWFAILDINTGKGIAANAGHEHPVIKRADGKYELVVYRHSPAIATLEGMTYRQHEFELHPGDKFFVYTDGVPEATNAENKLFGTDRMLAALNRDPEADLHQLLANVRREIDDFVQDAPQFDDITMLGFEFIGRDPK